MPRAAKGRARVAVILGDGIGVETVGGSRRSASGGGSQEAWLELETFPWGCGFYSETGTMMPSDALERLSGFDAIFLEAEGDPSVPDDGTVWELVLAIRRHFRQYVNVGPVRRFDGVRTPN